MEQITKYMATQGYKDALLAGLIDPIKVKPDWNLAIPPPAARAAVPLRGDSQPNKRFQSRPSAGQAPLVTPQAARYAAKPEQKLHITNPVEDPFEYDDLPDLVPDHDELITYNQAADDALAADDFEYLPDGTKLYHLSTVMVANLPTLPALCFLAESTSSRPPLKSIAFSTPVQQCVLSQTHCSSSSSPRWIHELLSGSLAESGWEPLQTTSPIAK